MKSAAIAALAAIGAVSAMPSAYASFKNALTRRADGPTDTQVLQYALTLENLEKRLYADALSQFDEAAFEAAGCPNWVRGRISQIAGHEADHVSLLSGALGNDSVAECTYNFPYTDVKSFLGLVTLIENVGVSAYAGAAQYITDKDYLTVAAVILSTEARHQAWESSAVGNANPWGSAYDTPLDLNMVYTLASAFITSCPDSNAALPVKAYPTLAVGDGYAAGSSAQFTFDDDHSATNYVIFYEGLGSRAVQLDANDMATIPSELQGVVYALVSTSSDPMGVSADNIVAGPAILNFPFSAWAENPAFSG
ncbi:uncharacterized protein I303_106407 [Kwoniella dejecticola CBS 10117]|uniref:Ferritin-like domain-containing protein n=1 Tax=Kwoniella dejecticola CBS 10117 TaxID=1296121 RepID=A0A1A5ZUT0_9TREE|nr:uncharacterized protein I303_08334 [Kwoniella dejecticola CBS 10117]OBR81564.1 hypothetical protein I303_08334 [Kwoniella dejecticola CBS 10117]